MNQHSVPPVTVRPLVNGALHVAWVTDRTGLSGGACDPDPDRAARRAAAEYAERASQVSAATAVRTLTGAGGQPRVEPAAWLSAGCPPTSWVTGRCLRDGTELGVPAQAVFLGWDPPPGEVRWCVQTSIGTGAGPDDRRARESALRELIERHVLMRGWRTGRIRFERLDPTRALAPKLLSALRDSAIELLTVRVAGQAPNTVVALLYRPGGARLTCGAAVRGGTDDAVRHAVCEAVAARLALSRPRPASTLQDRDRAAGLAAAAAGERHLRFVTERIVGDGEPMDSPDDLDALLDAAEAVFGRAPADVTLPQVDGHVVHHLVSRSGEIPETLYGPFLPCPLA